MAREDRTYLLANSAVVFLFHEAFVNLQHSEHLLIGSIVNERTTAVRAGDCEALLVIPRLSG